MKLKTHVCHVKKKNIIHWGVYICSLLPSINLNMCTDIKQEYDKALHYNCATRLSLCFGYIGYENIGKCNCIHNQTEKCKI